MSPSATAIEEVQDVPEPLYEGVLAIAAPPDENVQVGCWMASELVIVRDTVSPLFASPEPVVASAMLDRVGAVRSTVTAPESAEVSAVPTFPAASVWLPHENTVFCSVSSPDSVSAAVHDVPDPPMLAFSPSIVHARLVTDSLTVIVRVIVSPLFAYPLLLLLVVIAMLDRVGCVLSTVTLELSVVAVTAVPALAAESVNAIEKATAPSESASAVSRTQVQSLFCGLATVIELSAIASPPEVNVQVGLFWTVSDAGKLRVMSSPLFEAPSPLVAIDTDVSVGCVLSMVTLVPSVTAVTAVPALSAESEKAIEKVTPPLASLS